MGPGRFGGPPPHEMNEKLKEPKPKSVKEIPGFVRRLKLIPLYRIHAGSRHLSIINDISTGPFSTSAQRSPDARPS